jgi:acyl dehydratase
MIDAFAQLTGDHQWIHVDVERAKRESPFGTTIAHGFLTLSLLPRLSTRARGQGEFEIVGHGNVVNYGSDKLRFLSPVPAGARVRAHSRLASVEAAPKGTRVAREVAVHVVGSEKPALLYEMIALYQRSVASAPRQEQGACSGGGGAERVAAGGSKSTGSTWPRRRAPSSGARRPRARR